MVVSRTPRPSDLAGPGLFIHHNFWQRLSCFCVWVTMARHVPLDLIYLTSYKWYRSFWTSDLWPGLSAFSLSIFCSPSPNCQFWDLHCCGHLSKGCVFPSVHRSHKYGKFGKFRGKRTHGLHARCLTILCVGAAWCLKILEIRAALFIYWVPHPTFSFFRSSSFLL